MHRQRARFRAEVLEAIRVFFRTHDHLEVDTPVLSPTLIPEAHLEAFRTDFIDPRGSRRSVFLVPSPEIWMKRLLAEGSGNIYQICKSFRNYETVGLLHNPEFTMLEWYTVGTDYCGSMDLTESLLFSLAPFDSERRFRTPFHRIRMSEAFERWANIPLAECRDVEDLARHAARVGVPIPEGASWEEAFHRVFLSLVEPRLPTDRPVFLTDYPSRVPVLARPASDPFFVERWELYVAGVELANCFTEETDEERLRTFFRTEAAAKSRSREPHPVDQRLPALYSRIPDPTSGVAMGVDRLVSLLAGAGGLEGVILFPFSSIFG